MSFLFTRKPNWDSHLSPPGWPIANTIESHNRVIKADWTKYGRYHIVPLMTIFEEMIEYDADNFKERATVPHVPNTVIASARSLLKECRLIKLTDSVYEYTHQQEPLAGRTECITITDVLKECTCTQFHDKAYCRHVVAACISLNILFADMKVSLSETWV